MAATLTDPVAGPPATVDEVAGAARLAGALVDTLTAPIQHTHRAVSQRVFSTLGPVAAPVRVAHDAIAGIAYGSVRGGARLAGATAGAALGLTARGRDRRPVSAHPLGAQALSFASGLLGDWMDGRSDDLVVRVAVTQHGRPLGVDAAAVIAALPAPTDRLVLFVHGLAETNQAWSWWPEDADGAPIPTYAERLAAEGWTPLEVTYNTGLPVDVSGIELSALVADLAAAWPVPLEEIALVGHSMGGLVASAAVHHDLTADPAGGRWTDRVGHVVTLGTPHGGSWLARLAERSAASFARVPETQGLATILELRSPGIRDLTRGWRPPTPEDDGDDAGEVLTLAALLPHARHAFVGSAVRPPFDRIVGDGLVHARSATAPGRAAVRGGATGVEVKVHPGVGHIRLVHHPAVGDDLVAWMAERPAR